MIYRNSLPPPSVINQLTAIAQPFPKTVDQLYELAKQYGFDEDVLDLIELLPKDAQFANRDDFLTRLQHLALLIAQERQMPLSTVLTAEA